MEFINVLIGLAVLIGCIYWLVRANKEDKWTPDELPPLSERMLTPKDIMNSQMICPHCQTKGSVTTRQVKKKSGVHGGKATAAVLTLGWSLLATGLSRKERVTEAHCSNCGATWYF